MASRGEIYSTRADSEKRTYFFNVKENRRGDVFLNIVESNKREEGEGFNRHQVMIYQEDLGAFMQELNKAVAILTKKGQLSEAKIPPQKYKKKPPGGTVKNLVRTPSKKAGTQDLGRPATNLRRKKVSLKLKKKRFDDNES